MIFSLDLVSILISKLSRSLIYPLALEDEGIDFKRDRVLELALVSSLTIIECEPCF